MKERLSSLLNIKTLLFLFIFSIFYYKALIFIDPDFGWRIRAGEYYWNNSIPKTDIFTYTMPNFPWVDHAWGTSLIFFLVNSLLGYPALVFLISLFVVLIVLILTKSISRLNLVDNICKNLKFSVSSKYLPWLFINIDLEKIYPLSFFPLILVISIFLPFFGVRAQVVSWLMFSVLVYWLSDKNVFEKIKHYLPLFFLLWVNFHGSFALGIVVLFFYLFLKLVKEKKLLCKENFYGALSLVAMLINPYGIGVWREAWSSASDPRLRWSISEWMPALTMFDLAMVFLICLSIVFIWKYRKKYSVFELVLFIFLLTQAISSRRQLPLWAIFSFPLIARGILYFWSDMAKIKNASLRFLKIFQAALILSILIFIFQAVFSIKDSHAISIDKFYPVFATVYLEQNLTEGQIFSEYGWGGYLIWQLPQKKVFIDGRMPSWRWIPDNDNNLSSAYDTYNEVLKGKVDYKDVFKKFEIDAVLAHKESEKDEGFLLGKVKSFLSIFGWEENNFDFFKALENDGWQKVYEDEIAVIYQKE